MELTEKEIEMIQRSRANEVGYKGFRLTSSEEKKVLRTRIQSLNSKNIRLTGLVDDLKHKLHLANARNFEISELRGKIADLLCSEFDFEIADPEDHRHDDGVSEAFRIAEKIVALIEK